MTKEIQTTPQTTQPKPWYTTKLKGIPAEPGQTLQDLPRQVIMNWFKGLEQRWVDQYNARRMDGHNSSMTIGRG